MSRILLVVSAASELELTDGTRHATGVWAEELVVAHRALTRAGHEVLVASPAGVAPTIDPASLDAGVVGSADAVAEFSAHLETMVEALHSPLALAEVDVTRLDAIVLPGGHGPMVDLAVDTDLARILREALARDLVIAPFCHGPAGLLSAGDAFAGRRVTAFTNEEELTGGLGANSPWFVADRLSASGLIVEAGAAWSSFVVRDGRLISGQNPQSSEAVASAVIDALA